MGGGASKGSKRAGTSRKGKGDAFLSASPAPPQVPFEGPLERLSVPELRTFIEESGASYGDIFERSDLVERARRIGPLERLKPNALRRLLDATGRGHADCLEKSELVDRLRAAIDAGGKMAMEQQQDDASSSTDAQSAGDFATAAVAPAAPPPRAGAPTAPVPSQIRPGVLAAALDPPEEFREFRSPAEMRRQQKQRQAAHTLGATPAHTTQPPQQTTSPPQPQPNQQQQAAALHMLEARLAVEKERREAALAEKALLEQELVAARAAAQDERARSGEAAVENEMALADAQQQIAELTAELHRARRGRRWRRRRRRRRGARGEDGLV